MGCWDAPCIICGAPPTSGKTMYLAEEGMPPKYHKITKWLENCTMLLPDGQILHNYEEIACNISFVPKSGDRSHNIEGKGYVNDINLLTGKLLPFGMWLHDDCWKYIKNYLGLDLSYNEIPEHRWIQSQDGEIEGINYGQIKKYQSQDFKFYEMFQNKDQWLTTSPLDSTSRPTLQGLGSSKDATKNRTRINKILSQLKLTKSEVKKREKRPSPPISATLVKANAFCMGNDGKVWKKVGGKWTKPKDFMRLEVELDYKNVTTRNAPNKNIILREQTSYEKNPVFILKYEISWKKYKPIKGNFKFMSTKDGYRYLFKYFKKYNLGFKVKEY